MKFRPPRDGAAAPAAPREFADPRIGELARIGLARKWLQVAVEIGFEAWMRVWPLLAEDESVQNDRQRVYLPHISVYYRYQRNQLISDLARQGLGPDDIRGVVRRTLREDLSEAHMHRLVKRALA
ncbi:MAG TPA: hypothetical protein VEC14_02640 [Reyranellaceae bacterium]|nr:hypothetical protein [Reyranellaceae bacterium]